MCQLNIQIFLQKQKVRIILKFSCKLICCKNSIFCIFKVMYLRDLFSYFPLTTVMNTKGRLSRAGDPDLCIVSAIT